MRWLVRFAGSTLAAAAILSACLVLGCLWGAGVTGHAGRGYTVLGGDTEVTVAGQKQKASELAALYEPKVRVDRDHTSPELDTISYEVVDGDGVYTLLYHLAWRDQKHPNPLINIVQRVVRSAYLTSPPRDVRRVRVDVAKPDGAIRQVGFQGLDHIDDGAEVAYTDPEPPERPVRFVREADGTYARSTDRPDGTTVTVRPVNLPAEGRQVIVGPVTWNHLLDVVTEGSKLSEATSPVLQELTNDRYADGKFARKYTGLEFSTTEDPDDIKVASTVATLVFVGGALAVVLARRRNREV